MTKASIRTIAPLSRRRLLAGSGVLLGGAATIGLPRLARAQGAPVKIGFMLPYTGTFAQIGIAIENGFRMALAEQGGKVAGREVQWFKVDDE